MKFRLLVTSLLLLGYVVGIIIFPHI